MLANVHHQIATREVLPWPDPFWYYLLDLPFGIQIVVASFQQELEHLIIHEAPRSAILSSTVGIDVPLLRTFIEILSGNGPEYDSDDIDYNAPLRMCYHIDGEDLAEEAPRLTPPDQSPRCRVAYL
jgi:hypothetical protein